MRTLLCAGWLGFAFASGLFASQDGGPSPAEAPPKTTKHKPSIASNLVFDATTKHYDAKVGDTKAIFEFNLTNTWTNEIIVDRAETSCGCTLASLPSNPWHIAPGEHGVVGVTVNLEGKGAGEVTKFVTLYLSANGNFLGTRVATVKITIPEHPDANAMAKLPEADRQAAMLQAKADPRKIFTDAACAKCHADRGRKAATGPELYAADCAICHDSPNRASFVPDLHALKTPVSLEYWTTIVTYGKTNSLMPGFASFKGGPLNENQVHILAQYLATGEFGIPRTATNAATKVPVPSEP